MKRYSIIAIAICLLIACSQKNESNQQFSTGSASTFSFKETSVTLPSPASVQLDTDGRFYDRFQGNMNYLNYQYDHYSQENLKAFAARNYSPGKLLERMWDGEYAGKWLDAATRVAVNTRNKNLIKKVDDFARSLRHYQQSDGYMGVKLPRDRSLNDWEKSWDNWNQWNCMIGFLTHYEFRKEPASLDAASAIGHYIIHTFNPEKDQERQFLKCRVTGGMTNAVIIGQLMRLYRHTQENDLLKFVRRVIDHYPPIRQMLDTGEPFLFHPYMLGAVLNGALRFAEATQNREMLFRIEEVWDGLVTNHMFPTGSLGESEDLDARQLEDVPDGQLQETCATTEWIFLTQKLYAVTGRTKYAEALELTCYNALLAAQSPDGMKWCYWTPLRYSKHFLHGPTRCCFWSGPRGMARLPQLIYAVQGNGVYVNFFESSHGTLSTEKGAVQIKQKSQFPSEGVSLITLKAPKDWEGMVYIRIPSWASQFRVSYQGNLVPDESVSRGYAAVKIDQGKVHKVAVQFDIPLIFRNIGKRDAVIRRGPEVLAIDVRDNIDTWLGQDDLISLRQDTKFLPLESVLWDQWAGPRRTDQNRRCYHVKVNDARTSEPRSVIMTPYADAGNENAAFRTVFPLAENEDE